MPIDWGEYRRQKELEALHEYRLRTDPEYAADHHRRQQAEADRRAVIEQRLQAARAVGVEIGSRVQIRHPGQPCDGAVGTVVSVTEGIGQLLAVIHLDPVVRTTPLPKLPAFAIRRRDLREVVHGAARLSPLIQAIGPVDVHHLRVLASCGIVSTNGSGAAG